MAFRLLLVLIISLLWFDVSSQEKTPIQFSGVVVSDDSLSPIPFTNIIIKNTNRGTASDYYGFFSFVALMGDTIEFSCIGYKKSSFVIPDSLDEARYSLIQILSPDTYLIRTAVIYPWPSKDDFREAFLTLDIPDDDYERAMKNLARAELKARREVTAMDGSENYKQYMGQYQSKLYYAGQYAPNNLLNPLAWAEFIKAWKRGDFKEKE